MVSPLQRVLVCSPRIAGWNQQKRASAWRDLRFRHAPSFEIAESQHGALVRELKAAGAEVFELPSGDDLSLDAVYTHDASLHTDYGLIVMHPGKPNRIAEARRHAEFCRSIGIPVLGQIEPPGKTEAGDDCGRVVARPVVDDDDLEDRLVARRERAHGGGDAGGLVERGDQLAARRALGFGCAGGIPVGGV